jgi:hypothetical protein
MIPKSGNRFSEKIMLKQEEARPWSIQLDRIMVSAGGQSEAHRFSHADGMGPAHAAPLPTLRLM